MLFKNDYQTNKTDQINKYLINIIICVIDLNINIHISKYIKIYSLKTIL
jgi:hypothetical protein